jgi:C1A family cysteine protease
MKKWKIFSWLIKPKKQEVPPVKFGWVRDLPDHRDFKFKVTVPKELPALVDLRDKCPPVYNQGTLGSCTANALGAAFQFEQMKQKVTDFIPSRLFIYYNEREMEGTVKQDSGAMIRTGIKTMVKEGVCPEDHWKYNINKFKLKPPPPCYRIATDNQVLEYQRITPHTLYEVKQALVDEHPVVFGFMVYESMMTPKVAKTGYVPVPQRNDRATGGHAVMAVGYDDSKEALIVRNSWGTQWGINGYFYLPYWYVTTPNVSADYWTIRLVESENK